MTATHDAVGRLFLRLRGKEMLHDRDGIAAVDGAPVAVTNALRPTDDVILGGASGDLCEKDRSTRERR